MQNTPRRAAGAGGEASAGPREEGMDGRTDSGPGSGPGPGPPPHSLALLAVIEHDGVVVAA